MALNFEQLCKDFGAVHGHIFDHSQRLAKAQRSFLKEHEGKRDEIEQQLQRDLDVVRLANENTMPELKAALSEQLPVLSKIVQENAILIQSIVDREDTLRTRRAERTAKRQSEQAPEREAYEHHVAFLHQAIDDEFELECAALRADYEEMGVVLK